MNLHKYMAAVLSALIMITVNASAESLADRRNERAVSPLTKAMQYQKAQSSIEHDVPVDASGHSTHEYKLKYTSGSELKDYPHLTAHQRKRLIFGSD